MTILTAPNLQLGSLASLPLTFGFLTMLVSGIILEVAPQGKIARGTAWTVWLLGKEE